MLLMVYEMEICLAYVSKIEVDCEKQIFFFNDRKRRKRRLALSCGKNICIIKVAPRVEKTEVFKNKVEILQIGLILQVA